MISAKIKMLEWHNFDAWTHWAEGACGTYHVEERNGYWQVELRVGGLVHGVTQTDDTTPADLDAAKAAAQADYEARILAALEPAPVTPAEAAQVQALVDAGERMTGPLWRLILADENCIKNPCDLPTCECRQKFNRIAGPWFAAIAALKDASK